MPAVDRANALVPVVRQACEKRIGRPVALGAVFAIACVLAMPDPSDEADISLEFEILTRRQGLWPQAIYEAIESIASFGITFAALRLEALLRQA